MAATTLSHRDHQALAEAVRAAETRTSGEIFCVLARASDHYFFPAAFIVTVAVVALSLVLAFAIGPSWTPVEPWAVVAAQAVAIASALLVLGLAPSLRIRLVPRRLLYRRAHDNALRQFLARNVHRTAARTGVLLFVSLAERYAVVIADAGIDGKVDQRAWDGVVATLVSHAARDAVAEGFLAAIAEVGGLLALHFPPAAGDVNELADHVAEI